MYYKSHNFKHLDAKPKKSLKKIVPKNKQKAQLWTPNYIPFFIHDVNEYKLSYSEAIIYCFIRYGIEIEIYDKFYFSDKQLSEILFLKPKTISNSIAKLKKKGVISTKRVRKAGGGTIRFIIEYKYLEEYAKDDDKKIKEFKKNKKVREKTQEEIREINRKNILDWKRRRANAKKTE